MKNAIVMYVPVIHRGHIQLILGDANVCDHVFLVTEELMSSINQSDTGVMNRTINSLNTLDIIAMFRSIFPEKRFAILSETSLNNFDNVHAVNDEIVLNALTALYPKLVFNIKLHSVFLRWSKTKLQQFDQVIPDMNISKSEIDRMLIGRAVESSENSEDWWRQVGGLLLFKDGSYITSYNHHMPTVYTLNIMGDPRSNFNPGEHPEVYTSIHAEASLVATAAKNGLMTEGASLYVTTFPCPNCARLVVNSGIKKVYYKEGYSVVDAMDLFKTFGIDIVLVQ